jgi:hypothetical protein
MVTREFINIFGRSHIWLLMERPSSLAPGGVVSSHNNTTTINAHSASCSRGVRHPARHPRRTRGRRSRRSTRPRSSHSYSRQPWTRSISSPAPPRADEMPTTRFGCATQMAVIAGMTLGDVGRCCGACCGELQRVKADPNDANMTLKDVVQSAF